MPINAIDRPYATLRATGNSECSVVYLSCLVPTKSFTPLLYYLASQESALDIWDDHNERCQFSTNDTCTSVPK